MTTRVQARLLGIRADPSHTASQLRQWQAIADFDLTRVRARLLREGELDADTLDTAFLEFRRYLGLQVAEPRPLAMFSKEVDEVWHTCVLFTRLYAQLCTEAFGHFLHHEPTDEAEPDAEAEWAAFADAYTALYDEPPGAIWSPPISRRDIDGLETSLNTLAQTLSPGERVALGRLLALAVLGTEDVEETQAPPSEASGRRSSSHGPVAFGADGAAYDRAMGRYSRELAPQLIEFAGIESGMRVLDVGCGPGAVAERLAEQLGPELVSAADPLEQIVAACAERVPGADVRRADAENLPWPEGTFDAALAQLVLSFMGDPHGGVAEMRRVVRPGGVVAACVWDQDEGMQMLSIFWDAARALGADTPDDGKTKRFRSADALKQLWRQVGLDEVTTAPLVLEMTYADFADFWDPLPLSGGPGSYCRSLDPGRRLELRDELFVRLGAPAGPFTLSATAWVVRGVR